jgi:hypothetical protein
MSTPLSVTTSPVMPATSCSEKEPNPDVVRKLIIQLFDPFGSMILALTYEESAFGLAFVMEQAGIEVINLPFGLSGSQGILYRICIQRR